MPRPWSWLRRACAGSRPTAAPPRPLRHSPDFSRTPGARSPLHFDVLEDRLAPSVTSLSTSNWRDARFFVDDVQASAPAPEQATVNAVAYSNQSFGSQIGLDKVFSSSSYRGTGYTVAVIDTGIDYNNPALGGGWGKRVVAGWDFVNNDADPMDDNGHGTHVAGIIGASNATYSGIAPDVNLVALKVLAADGSGSFGAVDDALKWVIANRAKYNIVAVNMSLGSGNYTISPYSFLDGDFQTLKSQGVFLSVAAGNSFYSYQSEPGLAFPAISSQVVAVGAVWDNNFGAISWGSGARDNTTAIDRVASFSQRGAGLDIMAPGAMITSTVLGNKWAAMAGTSMASPVIAGSAVLLRQALDAAGKTNLANQDSILSIMRSTGIRVVDGDDENDNVTNTGLAFQRINLYAALQSVGVPTKPTTPTNGAPTLAAIADQSVAPGGTITISLSATDPNGDPLTYSANIVGQSTDSNQAYQLQSSLGLTALGSYYQNSFGLNEKWIGGSNGAFYLLLPSGELRRWTGTPDSTLAAANLLGTLDAKYYNDPSLLLNAQPAPVSPVTAIVTGSTLTVSAAASATGSYQIEVIVSDGSLSAVRTFTLTIGDTPPPVNQAPVWTAIGDKQLAGNKPTLTIALKAADPDGQPLTYSARVVGAASVGAAIGGNQLTLTPPKGYAGTFTVEVTASDGELASKTTFRVIVSNAAPSIAVAARVTADKGAKSASTPITVADADGDALTITAKVATATSSSEAYRLKTTYNLTFFGSYFTNAFGLGEKWLRSADGLQFFVILRNGEVHRFTGTLGSLTSAATLIGKLDASHYADPSKLWNAAASAPVATATVANGRLTVTLLQTSYRGPVSVDVTATDGLIAVKKTVVVTFS
jgi:subtilisin family serine protease